MPDLFGKIKRARRQAFRVCSLVPHLRTTRSSLYINSTWPNCTSLWPARHSAYEFCKTPVEKKLSTLKFKPSIAELDHVPRQRQSARTLSQPASFSILGIQKAGDCPSVSCFGMKSKGRTPTRDSIGLSTSIRSSTKASSFSLATRGALSFTSRQKCTCCLWIPVFSKKPEYSIHSSVLASVSAPHLEMMCTFSRPSFFTTSASVSSAPAVACACK